jgi:hypothetical protein
MNMNFDFMAQRSLDFQGPPLPMALVMDFPSPSRRVCGMQFIHFMPITSPPAPSGTKCIFTEQLSNQQRYVMRMRYPSGT